jgi:hypothetical protein
VREQDHGEDHEARQGDGGEGGVPLLFFFRDNDKNQLMIVQAQ